MRVKDVNILIVAAPGPLARRHWQARWVERIRTAKLSTAFSRCDGKGGSWVAALKDEMAGLTAPAVVVGHGLGCIAIAYGLVAEVPRPVVGAFLVAPADIEARDGGRALFESAPLERPWCAKCRHCLKRQSQMCSWYALSNSQQPGGARSVMPAPQVASMKLPGMDHGPRACCALAYS